MRNTRLLLLSILAAGMAFQTSAFAQDRLQYNRDIDKRDAAIDYGAIAAGQPDESLIVERIFSADEKQVMPPPATKKKLTDLQKETLKRWIAEGAEYQPHWSLLPIARPEPPRVENAA